MFPFADTVNFYAMEVCENWKDLVTLQIDFCLSVFFIVYFWIRFLAADDKLAYLFTIESLVDFYTIPPVFLSGA